MKPVTYFEWEPLLVKFGEGELPPLEKMETMSSPTDNGYLLRFYQKVSETWNCRKNHWIIRFNRLADLMHIKNPAEFELMIRDARLSLLPLRKFSNMQGFPENLKKELQTDLDGFVETVRDNLLKGIDRNHPSREVFIRCIKTLALPPLNTQQSEQPSTIGKNNRTIIF